MRTAAAVVAMGLSLVCSSCGWLLFWTDSSSDASEGEDSEAADGEEATAAGGKSRSKRRLARKGKQRSAGKGKPGGDEAALPEHCAGGGKHCFPPRAFATLLCEDKYPGVALLMFEKSAPWEHAFVRVKEVDAVNPVGGPAADSRLVFTEEVLILRHRRNATGGMQVSGPDSYDVLRLDGTCALLQEGEFFFFKPHRVTYAPVVWKSLDNKIQQALSEHEEIEQKRQEQRKGCRGVSLGGGTTACQRATKELTKAIRALLAAGVALPSPSRMPDWSPHED